MIRYSFQLVFLFLLIPIASMAQTAEPTPAGDINGDGIIDWHDLFVIAQHWQVTGNSVTVTPTSTPSPTLTPQGIVLPPGPTNIRFEGEQVYGRQNTFYEQVTISWDPIPGFDIQDASKYYKVSIEYLEGSWENFSFFDRLIDEATSITITLDDPEFEDLNGFFVPAGYYVYVCAIEKLQIGFGSRSLWSGPHYFNLIRRPTPTPTPTAILTPTP